MYPVNASARSDGTSRRAQPANTSLGPADDSAPERLARRLADAPGVASGGSEAGEDVADQADRDAERTDDQALAAPPDGLARTFEALTEPLDLGVGQSARQPTERLGTCPSDVLLVLTPIELVTQPTPPPSKGLDALLKRRDSGYTLGDAPRPPNMPRAEP